MSSPIPHLRAFKQRVVGAARRISPLHIAGNLAKHITPTYALNRAANHVMKRAEPYVKKASKRIRAFVRKKTGFTI